MRPLHHAIQAFRYFNLVAFIALGAVTLVFWLRRRDRASRWAAVAFGALGLLELLTLVPNHPGNIPERAVGRVAIALIVVFPYLLFRFTNVFRTPKRRLQTGSSCSRSSSSRGRSRSRGFLSRASTGRRRSRRGSSSSSCTGRSCRSSPRSAS